MDDCSADDMTSLAAVSRPRPAMPVGQALPANGEDWTLDHLRGKPLPEAKAIASVFAFARRQTFTSTWRRILQWPTSSNIGLIAHNSANMGKTE